MGTYTTAFFDQRRDGARRSARVIVPLVLELIGARSVIDVGCGTGTWLAVFAEFGVHDIFGVDGEYVDRRALEVPEDRFVPFNLERPLDLGRRFDLVVSLEVAEHLPPASAEVFVDSLTRLGPVVLFSAAVPFQGGTNHLNEQWPEYWAELFRRRGYVPVDCVRHRVWQHADVEWWYVQNALVFATEDYVASHDPLLAESRATRPRQLSVVHPRAYLAAVERVIEAATVTQPGDGPSTLRATVLARMLSELDAAYYGRRDLRTARELAGRIRRLYPDADVATRARLRRIAWRSRLPRVLFRTFDRLGR